MTNLRGFKILDYVSEKKYCTLEQLMAHFKVSQATIHRDIAELAGKGLLRRVYGGVVSIDAQLNAAPPTPEVAGFVERLQRNQAEKQRIAAAAAREIKDNDIIFLDSSTTCLCLAREIRKSTLHNLTLVTNSILITQEFHLFPPNFVLVSLGGSFNHQLNSTLGRMTRDNLQAMTITKLFFSGVGISAAGASTYYEPHAEFLQTVLRMASENYLLMDSSKFSRSGLYHICALPEIDCLISDANPGITLKRLIIA